MSSTFPKEIPYS